MKKHNLIGVLIISFLIAMAIKNIIANILTYKYL
jgi:hypothetical protein